MVGNLAGNTIGSTDESSYDGFILTLPSNSSKNTSIANLDNLISRYLGDAKSPPDVALPELPVSSVDISGILFENFCAILANTPPIPWSPWGLIAITSPIATETLTLFILWFL